MKTAEYIAITDLCNNYEVEVSFFTRLRDIGLLDWKEQDEVQLIHTKHVANVEKIIRIHRDLDVNPQGIDVIFNLLNKMERLTEEVRTLRERLQIYES